MNFPANPAIPLLRINVQQQVGAYVQNDAYTRLLIATRHRIAKMLEGVPFLAKGKYINYSAYLQ